MRRIQRDKRPALSPRQTRAAKRKAAASGDAYTRHRLIPYGKVTPSAHNTLTANSNGSCEIQTQIALYSETIFHTIAAQGRTEVRWRPWPETSLAPPCSNLRSFGSKFTVLKNVHLTLLGLFGASHSHLAPPAVIRRPGNCAPLAPPRYAPVAAQEA